MSHKNLMVVGNWKMNGVIESAISFCKSLPPLETPLYIAMPFTCIHPTASLDIPLLQIGAQNMHSALEGAYTGEISAIQLKDAKASFVIIGHSERREIFKEDNEFINHKVLKALEEKLFCILCIGETLIDKQNDKTKEILKEQLLKGLERVSHDQIEQIAIAYEPVWAIGSGEPATPQVIQEVHYYIKQVIEEKWGLEAAENVTVLYGGSVNEKNIKEITDQPDVGGVLVGGASLKIDSFLKIIQTAKAN